MLPEEAAKNRNSEVQYSAKTWAYYRVKGYDKNALVDQFTDKPLFYAQERSLDDVIGQDFIPSDVCPLTFEKRAFYMFDGQQAVGPQALRVKLNQT